MHKIDLHINQRLHEEHQKQQEFLNLVRAAPNKPPEDTLIKYSDPRVIAVQDSHGVFHPVQIREVEEASAVPVHQVISVYQDFREANRLSKCSSHESSAAEIRAILDRAFPPIIWRQDDKIYRRIVSSKPATLSDLVGVQDKLDTLLSENNLKPTGLSEKRRKYFTQCFDELARQEVIACIPRGLLLLRIRDEIRLSLAAFESLYLSNAAYGARKAIKVEMNKQKVETEFDQLTNERNELLDNIKAVRSQLDEQAEKFRLNSTHAKRMFLEERDNLRRHNQNLKSQLEAIVSGSSHNHNNA